VDNNNLYQIVLFFSSIAGCLGSFAFLLGAVALLGLPSWLSFWLALILALFLGYIYGEIQATIVCRFPRIREWGEVTTAGFCKVGGPYIAISLLIVILFPVFMKALEKAHAMGKLSSLPAAFLTRAPLALLVFPVVLSGIVAVVGWGLHASERQRRRPRDVFGGPRTPD
jgi:hypothetical protein